MSGVARRPSPLNSTGPRFARHRASALGKHICIMTITIKMEMSFFLNTEQVNRFGE